MNVSFFNRSQQDERRDPTLDRIDSAAEQIRDPDVADTIARITATTKERNELRHLIAERDHEIEIMREQLDFYKSKLTECSQSRDRWQRYAMRIATRLSDINLLIGQALVEAREEAEREPQSTDRPDAQTSAAALEAAIQAGEEPQS